MTIVLSCWQITGKTCCLSRNRLSLTLNVAITNFKYVAHLFANYSFHTKKNNSLLKEHLAKY